MLASEFEYDVYNTPVFPPIQFGEYVAAEGGAKERLRQGAKYVRRMPRVRAWYARNEISEFLQSAKKNMGNLDAALSKCVSQLESSNLGDGERQNAMASADCLKKFISFYQNLKIGQKDLIALPKAQDLLNIESVELDLRLSCLIKSVSKDGVGKIGALLLNTQKGEGLGSRDETIARRDKAGEAVSLLILRAMIEKYADHGEAHHTDCIHYYVRGDKHWSAPKAYVIKMKNIEAEARAIASLWDGIKPPTDFNPDKAAYHN